MLVCSYLGNAQPYSSVNLYNQKPKQYENRNLRSEKTEQRSLSRVGRFFQNGFTHYNYHFNANNKINDILERAKASFKEDYTQLLPYYNYTLDATSQYKQDIDSIIYKCNAAILLHDLRSDWVDNMYLILGKAFFLNKQLDSAAHVFQFLNHAWSPNDEGYILPLASNSSNTNGIFTIATKEKRNVVKDFFSRPSSRNEALLWMVRNYVEENKLSQASALMADIRTDTFFPKKLRPFVHELAGYIYYKEKKYDSAAWHLEHALDNAENRQEAARWRYLCGQLYQRSKQDSAAIHLFEKSISSSNDPMLEVYARLNIVDINNAKKKNALAENLTELYHLARREKYENYRDIIYYAIATLEAKQKNVEAATKALVKSLKNNTDNPLLRQKGFLLMADVAYRANQFVLSAQYYDSIKIDQLDSITIEKNLFRKTPLKKIATNILTIQKEDSLQNIAALPDDERILYVKKISKKLRKAEGLKEETFTDISSNSKNADLFGSSQSTESYFNNTSLLQKGLLEFKARWGNRPNVDNWRRQSAVEAQTSAPKSMNLPDVNDMDVPTPVRPLERKEGMETNTEVPEIKDISFEGLMSKLPLSKELKMRSDSLIMYSLLQNGQLFQYELQNFPQAILAYESILQRYKRVPFFDQLAYQLYGCYKLTNNSTKAAKMKDILLEGFSKSPYTALLTQQQISRKDSITQVYAKVYQLFVEGQVEAARLQKKEAEVMFGQNIWSAQLLYLECLGYIQEKQYATAGEKLRYIIENYATSPIAEKATTMLQTLYRRESIEDHLTYSTEEKMIDSVEARVNLTPTDVLVNQNNIPGINTLPSTSLPPPSLKLQPNKIAPAEQEKTFVHNNNEPFWVAVIFNANSEAFNEAKNAINRYNKEKFYNQTIEQQTHTFDANNKWLLMGSFDNPSDALDYFDKLKLQAPASIMAWIPKNSYHYSIISKSNLALLKKNNNINAYNLFLKSIFPDKF